MRKWLYLCMLSTALLGSSGGCSPSGVTARLGDNFATIGSTSYYWKQSADNEALITAVRGDTVISVCTVRGPVYGARQDKNGEIYILCGDNQVYWLDIRHLPSMIDLITEDEM